MPMFGSGLGLAPSWCEMEYFEIVELVPGAVHTFERMGRKEKLIVGKGTCRVSVGSKEQLAEEGAAFDLATPDDCFAAADARGEVTLVRMCGRWGEETGSCGVFRVANQAEAAYKGDRVDYPKATDFDNHYHDCDEYWVVFEGRGLAISEGERYIIGVGDCLATGMGHHHDLPEVFKPIAGVYFETTLEGRKRLGHLWEHTHGAAKPRPERV